MGKNHCVVFDLDGTLADTIQDIAASAGVSGAYATWGYGFPAESVFRIGVDSFERFTQFLLNTAV